MFARSWEAWTGLDELPPDLTPTRAWAVRLGGSCRTQSRGGFICTRLRYHTGRHAAGDAFRIRAVWE